MVQVFFCDFVFARGGRCDQRPVAQPLEPEGEGRRPAPGTRRALQRRPHSHASLYRGRHFVLGGFDAGYGHHHAVAERGGRAFFVARRHLAGQRVALILALRHIRFGPRRADRFGVRLAVVADPQVRVGGRPGQRGPRARGARHLSPDGNRRRARGRGREEFRRRAPHRHAVAAARRGPARHVGRGDAARERVQPVGACNDVFALDGALNRRFGWLSRVADPFVGETRLRAPAPFAGLAPQPFAHHRVFAAEHHGRRDEFGFGARDFHPAAFRGGASQRVGGRDPARQRVADVCFGDDVRVGVGRGDRRSIAQPFIGERGRRIARPAAVSAHQRATHPGRAGDRGGFFAGQRRFLPRAGYEHAVPAFRLGFAFADRGHHAPDRVSFIGAGGEVVVAPEHFDAVADPLVPESRHVPRPAAGVALQLFPTRALPTTSGLRLSTGCAIALAAAGPASAATTTATHASERRLHA